LFLKRARPHLGILKLCDFGIAEFAPGTSGTPSHAMFGTTRPYCAPELLVGRHGDGAVDSMNDIWSLGCVFLECVAWYQGGWVGVESFLERRSTPEDDGSGLKIPTFFETEKNPKTGQPTKPRVKTEVVKVRAPQFQHTLLVPHSFTSILRLYFRHLFC
jgi:serine/threonine protein kinase